MEGSSEISVIVPLHKFRGCPIVPGINPDELFQIYKKLSDQNITIVGYGLKVGKKSLVWTDRHGRNFWQDALADSGYGGIPTITMPLLVVNRDGTMNWFTFVKNFLPNYPSKETIEVV